MVAMRRTLVLVLCICAMVALSVGAPWRDVPEAQALTIPLTATGADGNHTCVLTGTGGVKCWGDNANGQLGNDITGGTSGTPQNVCAAAGCASLLSGVTWVAAGNGHTCAVLSDTTAKCWGQNAKGQLGDGTIGPSDTPVKVCASGSGAGCPALSGIFRMSAGNSHTCARMTDLTVKCWGDDSNGQLGNDDPPSDSSLPVNVCAVGGCPTTLSGIIQVSAGQFHTCALTSGGGVKCWGDNLSGQLGDGNSATDSPTPVDVCPTGGCPGTLSGANFIGAGGQHSCAVVVGAEVRCWGSDSDGQLGNGAGGGSTTPVAVCAVGGCGGGNLTGVVFAGGGQNHSCASLTSGGAVCWGSDSQGQLANGVVIGSTDIPGNVCAPPSCTKPALDVLAGGGSTGAAHTCGITTARNLRCAGDNLLGQLGDGNAPTDSQVGVYVSGLAGKGLTLTVNSLLDDPDTNAGNGVCATAGAVCTLRAAIQESNASPNTDTIAFNISGVGPHTIAPTSALPTITNPVVIDGYTQPGASANTAPIGSPGNAVLKIEINGTSAGGGTHGLTTASGSTVRGLVINRFGGAGIRVSGSGNLITGNYIGTDATGASPLFFQETGVLIDSGAQTNTIGGANSAARNVISNNELVNVDIQGSGTNGNMVKGNYIGTNAAGTAGVGFDNGDGVRIRLGAQSNTVGGMTDGERNVISDSGVRIEGAGTNLNSVKGNYIGTNAAGTAAVPNSTGVTISGGAQNNIVGGTTTGERNVISGNILNGILLNDATTTGNTVQGNYVGTNAAGTAAIANSGSGVVILSAASNTVGGTAAGAGNVISGNTLRGVEISQATATSNIVQGNFVGTAADGTTPLGNLENGVMIAFGSSNTIGGSVSGAPNRIAHNAGDGVLVTQAGATGNAIRGNSVYANGGLGINLAPDGVTGNDNLDPDPGPNNLQNFPLLTSAQTGSAIIKGMFNSTASSIFLLDFYASTSCDASGNGEGQTYLGASAVVTDSMGNATFEVAFDAPLSAGQAVTATATDTGGNTSEFSTCSTATLLALSPLAGTGVAGDCGDGTTPAGSCAMNQPRGLFEIYPASGVVAGQVQAASGVPPALYYADSNNHKVKKIEPPTAAEPVDDVAGGGTGCVTNPTPPHDGCLAKQAILSKPHDVFIAGKSLFIADSENCRIRRVDLGTNVITTVAGTGPPCAFGGDGIATATSINLHFPTGVAVDASGNLYIAERDANRIRRIEHGGDFVVNGGAGETISTVAGGGAGCLLNTAPPAPFDGCLATEATFTQPHDLFFLAEDLVIADSLNNRIRRIDYPTGTISTIAGGGSGCAINPVPPHDGCLGTEATLSGPQAVMAANNKIVIADTGSNRIRMVDLIGHPADGSTPAVAAGTITTVADPQAPCRPAGCPPGVKLSEPAGVFIVTGATAADGALRVSNTLGQTITTAGIDPTGTHTTNIRPSVSCGNVPGISGIDWVLPVIMLGALAGRRRIGTFFTRLYIAAARRAPAPAVS